MHYQSQKRGGAVLEMFNYSIAAAAITSPLWLRDMGSIAAIIFPIFGVVWLSVQIAHRIKNWNEK